MQHAQLRLGLRQEREADSGAQEESARRSSTRYSMI
jgi:hypothetical protein